MTLLSKYLLPSLYLVVIVAVGLTLHSCGFYGFKGISIPSDIKTFYVEDFTRGVANCPVDLDQQFAEALRQKVRDQSRLTRDELEPDIAFIGSVFSYKIIPVAPQEGNTTSLNRLDISVKVEFINYKNEEENWTKSYSAFQDYDSNADFSSLEEGLTLAIVDDISERIFNEAFTNW